MIANKNITKKQYQDIWESFRDNVLSATTINQNETVDEKKKRIARLEKYPDEWIQYYFPEEAAAPPAGFHKAATKRVINNPEWYEVRNWSRELAKSTRSMMEDLYLMIVGHPVNNDRKKKKYKILISSTIDGAEMLMLPYKAHLEANARIINDYGQQEKAGFWDSNRIISQMGFCIKSFGYRSKVRGTKYKHYRPDIIEFDDFDTDLLCLNEELMEEAWNWVNKAAIGTRAISVPTLIRWNGNLIGDNCCIMRAREFANHAETINLTDDKGDSSWPEKNSNDDVKNILSKIPWSAQQTEYYNNPYTQGKAFKEIKWGKVPPLSKFQFLVNYADPATSNKDAGKGNSKSSMKAHVLVGALNGYYYVIKAKVNRMTNADFIDHFFTMDQFVNGKATVFNYVENNALQDPFYEQVLLPLFYQKTKQYRRNISLIPDTEKKPDKYTRIEGTLETPNRLGFLIFNAAEKNDEDMKRLVSQIKSVSPMSKTMDGPDALQGAVKKTNDRTSYQGGINLFARPNNKRCL